MSEEEKKAIEELEDFIEDDEIQNISVFTAKKIKNIIDKQQKEIEELRQYKESVEGLKSKNKAIIDNNEFRLFLKRDYISKDKIREKIKEYQEKYNNYPNHTPEDFEFRQEYLHKLSALEKLLEE